MTTPVCGLRRTKRAVEARHRRMVALAGEGKTRKEIALEVGTKLWNIGFHLNGWCQCGRPYVQQIRLWRMAGRDPEQAWREWQAAS